MRPARKTVGVALSGGGANALSQIGVLKALEEEQITIDYIAGTSMGAVIGGLYSSGYTPRELEKIALSLPWQSFFSFNNDYARSNIFLEQQRVRDRSTIAIRFEKLKVMIPKSLNSSQAMTGTLDLLALNALYHPSATFSTLPVNFRAVSTDLVSGTRITLDSGSLSEAMRASSTIPILFAPLLRDGHQLVDGGLVANLPVDELDTFMSGYKIAVDTHGSMYSNIEELDLPWKTADQAMTILTKLQYPAQLAKADMVITPDLKEHKATDFSDIQALLDAGYKTGKALAATIKRHIEKQQPPAPSIERYKKFIQLERESPELLTHYPDLTTLVQRATDPALTLQELLETDLFTKLYAERNPRLRTIVFHLFPLPEIQNVIVTGGPAGTVSSEDLRSCFKPLIRAPYTNRDGTKALEALIMKYRDNGYSLVGIESTALKNGTLEVRLSSGVVEQIEIQREHNLADTAPVERELKVDTTEALSLKKTGESIDNLYETGMFNQVSVSAFPPSNIQESRNPLLRFSLDEKPSSVLRLGWRYDDTNNAQFLLDFRNENFGGTSGSLGGWLKAGSKNNIVNLEFNMPRIASTHLTMSSRLFYDQHLFENRNVQFSKELFAPFNDMEKTYGIQKYGISSAFGTRIRKNGRLMVDMTLQNSQSYAERKDRAGLLTENSNMLSVGTQLTIDSRNSSQVPLSGNYTNIRYSMTPVLLDHGASLWQLSATHEENIKLSEQTTLQLSGVIGLSSSSMPLSEKFFLGGLGSAYSQRFIGLKANDLPGNNLATAGVHLLYKPSFALLFPTSLLLHYNAGNVWEERKAISLSGLIHGVGTSLLWETPLGPANFTVSKAFAFLENAKNQGTSSLRFSDTIYYFSLGHDF